MMMMMMIRHIVRVHPRDVTSRTLSLPGATLPALPYLKVWEAYHFSYFTRTRQFKLFGRIFKKNLAALPYLKVREA